MNFEEFLNESTSVEAHNKAAAAFHADAQKHPEGSAEHMKNMREHHWHAAWAAKKSGNEALSREHTYKSYGFGVSK